MISRHCGLLLLAAALAAAGCCQPIQPLQPLPPNRGAPVAPVSLWKPPTTPCAPADTADYAIVCRVVDVDLANFGPQTPTLELALPGASGVLTVDRKRTMPSKDGFVWDGAGPGRAYATFSVVKGWIVGDVVDANGAMFRLRYTRSRTYVIEHIDRAKLFRKEAKLPTPPALRARARVVASPASAPGSGPTPASAPVPGDSQPSGEAKECADDLSQIDVMVVYTPAAVEHNGNESALQARVNQAIAETNWAFTNSQVNTQLRNVHMGQLAYNAETNLSQALDVITNPADAGADDADTLNSVHALRDSVHADIVVFVVFDPGAAHGLSNPMNSVNVGTWFRSQAFAVVTEAGLTGSGSNYFAHEIGHVMGANHEDADGAFPYSRGKTGEAAQGCLAWGTIMTQPICAGCDALRLWASPLLSTCGGQAIGSIDHDNARTLNTTSSFVANFMCAPMP